MTEPATVASAEGIDVSAFQLDLTVHELAGFQFAFTKATDGLSITDPNFAHNWATIGLAGLHRGAYHELQARHPALQAAHFLAVVQGGGVRPGDMLAVVASDYPGVTDTEVLTFAREVHSATRGLNPVLVYTDLDIGQHLDRSSSAFPLWVAHPGTAPAMPLANWRQWRLWQWGTRLVPGLGHVDANGFNGTAADMDAWIASFKPKPKPPPPPPAHAAVITSGDGMFFLPATTETVDLTVPLAVVRADGTFAPPSELRLSCSAPAQFEVALGNDEPLKWQSFNIDHIRSPQALHITGPSGMPYGVVKVKRTDKGAAPVSGDFA